MMNQDFGKRFSGKPVLITGHTGFKGGWLALWLHELGATVHGYALSPPTRPSLFDVAGIGSVLASDTRGDVRDAERFKAALDDTQPETIFHLAAQSLVRTSYSSPMETMSCNVMGTATVLEAARTSGSVRALVVITSDKV